MKRTLTAAFMAASLAVGFCSTASFAKDTPKSEAAKSTATVKTITGTSGCATCEGITKDGHSILLTDQEGNRWVLIGEGKGYDAVHKVRSDSKKITATLAGEPVTKKGEDGKPYKEVKISDIKIDA